MGSNIRVVKYIVISNPLSTYQNPPSRATSHNPPANDRQLIHTSLLQLITMEATAETPTSPSARSSRGRGRRNSNSTPQMDNPHRGQGRGRGRSRGRGRGRGAPGLQSQENNTEASFGRPPGGSFGNRLTEAAPQTQDVPQQPYQPQPRQSTTPADAGDTTMQPLERKQSVAEDAEVCFICASPVEHISIAPCNHQTCHICSLRMRALYKTRACAHCRVSTVVSYHRSIANLYRLSRHSSFLQMNPRNDFKTSRTAISSRLIRIWASSTRKTRFWKTLFYC